MVEPKCSICTHPNRENIDIALASGTPLRKVASSFALSITSAHRHVRNHLIPKKTPQAERKAIQAEQQHEKMVGNIWEHRLHGTFDAARRGIERAEADPDKWTHAAGFIAVAIKACDTGLRASGAIATGTTINVDRMLVLPLAAAEQQQQLAAGDVVDVDAEEVEE